MILVKGKQEAKLPSKVGRK